MGSKRVWQRSDNKRSGVGGVWALSCAGCASRRSQLLVLPGGLRALPAACCCWLLLLRELLLGLLQLLLLLLGAGSVATSVLLLLLSEDLQPLLRVAAEVGTRRKECCAHLLKGAGRGTLRLQTLTQTGDTQQPPSARRAHIHTHTQTCTHTLLRLAILRSATCCSASVSWSQLVMRRRLPSSPTGSKQS